MRLNLVCVTSYLRPLMLGLLLTTAMLGPASAGAADGGPWIELELANDAPFVDEYVVLTVRLLGRGNLATVDLETPTVAGATLHRLDGPETVAIKRGGRRLIESRYRFALVAYQAGVLELPPITATVTKADGWHMASTARAEPVHQRGVASRAGEDDLTLKTQVVRLDVRAPLLSTGAEWRPLHGLKLAGHWEAPARRPRVGEPLTLVLEVEARGMIAERIPGLVEQLTTAGVNAYVDAVSLETGVTQDRQAVFGRRQARVTVVPEGSGLLFLPGLELEWWDLASQQATTGRLKIDPWYISEAAAPNGAAPATIASNDPAGERAHGDARHALAFYWLPLGVTVALAGGIHWSLRTGTRPSQGLGRLALAVRRAQRRLVTRTRMRARGLQRWGMRRLPFVLFRWWFVRRFDAEPDARNLCCLLQTYVRRRLNLECNVPLATLARRLRANYPGQANVERLAELCGRLEEVAYGPPGADLQFLKRRLRQAVMSLPPRPAGWASPCAPAAADDLPELNPALNPARGLTTVGTFDRVPEPRERRIA